MTADNLPYIKFILNQTISLFFFL